MIVRRHVYELQCLLCRSAMPSIPWARGENFVSSKSTKLLANAAIAYKMSIPPFSSRNGPFRFDYIKSPLSPRIGISHGEHERGHQIWLHQITPPPDKESHLLMENFRFDYIKLSPPPHLHRNRNFSWGALRPKILSLKLLEWVLPFMYVSSAVSGICHKNWTINPKMEQSYSEAWSPSRNFLPPSKTTEFLNSN